MKGWKSPGKSSFFTPPPPDVNTSANFVCSQKEHHLKSYFNAINHNFAALMRKKGSFTNNVIIYTKALWLIGFSWQDKLLPRYERGWWGFFLYLSHLKRKRRFMGNSGKEKRWMEEKFKTKKVFHEEFPWVSLFPLSSFSGEVKNLNNFPQRRISLAFFFEEKREKEFAVTNKIKCLLIVYVYFVSAKNNLKSLAMSRFQFEINLSLQPHSNI